MWRLRRGLLLALLFAPVAWADPSLPRSGDAFINPGLFLSLSPHAGSAVIGLGLELSYHQFTNDRGAGFGLFGQAQVMDDFFRFCGGVQGTTELNLIPVGAEVGVTYATSSLDEAATTSLHLAPFISLGFATASLRFDIPVQGGSPEKPRHPIDVGLVLAVKIPRKL